MNTPTFLFTDIEGSTALYERVGPVFRTALTVHHNALRRAIDQHGGTLVRDTGDGLIAAFENTAAAVGCAVAAQETLAEADWPNETGALLVRMGLHRGPADLEDGGYQGLTMHHASRVMSAAHGGQILCSAAVMAELSPEVVPFRDLGLYRLRGLPQPMRLFELITQHTRAGSRLPNAPAAFTHRLPAPNTRYFGREREIETIVDLLQPTTAERRCGFLLTVLGPGGTGKTRFAIEVATRLLPGYSHAVWFVPLAELREPSLLFEIVRDALGIAAQPGGNALEQVTHFLRAQPSLLVLDNLEQLLPSSALPILKLLEDVPSLSCLVTSRVRLGVGCEQEFPLQPLSVPVPDATPEQLGQIASVQLFLDRARAVRRDFSLSAGNAWEIAGLCRALEGIPLAIELAAARSAVLTARQMLTRFGHRLEFLTGGRRDVPERQRTLRAAIAWSYELLTPPLQLFLAKLSIFRGGWSLEAAEQVAGGPDGASPVEQLDELRASSLITVTELHGEMRYAMLEVIREYASEQLLLSGEAVAVEGCHHLWCVQFAHAAKGADDARAIEKTELEHDNLRAALERDGPLEERLRIAVDLYSFWMLRGHLREGREWLRRLIANGETINPALRAAAENAAGILAWKSGWLEDAEAHFAQALARWESEALREAGAGTLNNLGIVAVEQRRHDAARDYYRRSLAIYRLLDARARVAAVLSNLGSNELLAGRPDEARAPLLESLALQRALGEQSNCANTLHNLAEMHLLLGDSAAARRIFAESLAIRSRLGSRDNLFESFSTLARIALAEERAALCTILWSAAAAAIEELGQHLTAAAGAEMERDTAQLRAALGSARFAELARAGRGLPPGDVLDEDGQWSSRMEAREDSRAFS